MTQEMMLNINLSEEEKSHWKAKFENAEDDDAKISIAEELFQFALKERQKEIGLAEATQEFINTMLKLIPWASEIIMLDEEVQQQMWDELEKPFADAKTTQDRYDLGVAWLREYSSNKR
tara:strand:+ start:1596 stop:1952 length:357 start_codon:yes stop_codon:yes gene_type:complete